MALLKVRCYFDENVAHYTSLKKCDVLLFSKSKFRLTTITTTNDSKEGECLTEYLGLEINESYNQAFIGCFTFNHDCLNQFRLYGKEEGKEATGVSCVLNTMFFEGKLPANELSLFGGNTNLFRCIYLDPKTGKVISLGSREEYTFYRSGKLKERYPNNLHEKYQEYKDYIDEKLRLVKLKLAELKNTVDKNTVSLLTEIRFLIKHVSFKEEQECRLVQIKNLSDSSVIYDKDFMNIYTEYDIPFAENVSKVYFAPHTKGKRLFEERLKLNGNDYISKIQVQQSDHPLN